MSLIMRILRFLLNLLGISIPFLTDTGKTFDVTIDCSESLAYTVLQGATPDELDGNVYAVATGDSLSLIVYKYDAEQNVSVTREDKTENATVQTFTSVWTSSYDTAKETAYYYAIFAIDNVNADTVITIS